jgi:protein TonB
LATLAAFAFDDTVAGPAASRAAASPAMGGPGRDTEPLAFERSAYRASAGSRPVAFLASAAAILAMLAALGTLNMVSGRKDRHRLTVVEMRDLDVTPPPPPEPTKLETPPAAVTQTVAPKPLIDLPSQGPTQVMVDAPPPPAPPVVTSEGVKPTAAPAPAPAPVTTPDGGDLSSKVLYAKPPSYPVDARRAHEQGTVKLLLLVGSDGTVKDIQVATSSGSQRLDRAALAAVKRWRWSPTMSGGVATAVRGYVTIPFVLV